VSKELMVAIADAVFSTVLYFSVKYLDPSLAEDVKFLIGTIQVIVALWFAQNTIIKAYTMKLLSKFSPDQFMAAYKEMEK
jgi:hypothetical protein